MSSWNNLPITENASQIDANNDIVTGSNDLANPIVTVVIGFLVRYPSHIDKHNIKISCNISSWFVARKNISLALVELGKESG